MTGDKYQAGALQNAMTHDIDYTPRLTFSSDSDNDTNATRFLKENISSNNLLTFKCIIICTQNNN